MKQCRTCKEMKPYSKFYYRARSKSFEATCNDCLAEKHRERYFNNSDEIKAMERQRSLKYRNVEEIDFEEWYEKQLKKQNNKCAMQDCNMTDKTNTHGRLFGDHDPQTGKLRGLLCKQCNTNLGRYEEGKYNQQNRISAFESYINAYVL